MRAPVLWSFSLLFIACMLLAFSSMMNALSGNVARAEVNTHCRAVALRATEYGMPGQHLTEFRNACVREWTRTD